MAKSVMPKQRPADPAVPSGMDSGTASPGAGFESPAGQDAYEIRTLQRKLLPFAHAGDARAGPNRPASLEGGQVSVARERAVAQ